MAQKYHASEKKVQKMSRDGLRQENLVSQETERISRREQDALASTEERAIPKELHYGHSEAETQEPGVRGHPKQRANLQTPEVQSGTATGSETRAESYRLDQKPSYEKASDFRTESPQHRVMQGSRYGIPQVHSYPGQETPYQPESQPQQNEEVHQEQSQPYEVYTQRATPCEAEAPVHQIHSTSNSAVQSHRSNPAMLVSESLFRGGQSERLAANELAGSKPESKEHRGGQPSPRKVDAESTPLDGVLEQLEEESNHPDAKKRLMMGASGAGRARGLQQNHTLLYAMMTEIPKNRKAEYDQLLQQFTDGKISRHELDGRMSVLLEEIHTEKAAARNKLVQKVFQKTQKEEGHRFAQSLSEKSTAKDNIREKPLTASDTGSQTKTDNRKSDSKKAKAEKEKSRKGRLSFEDEESGMTSGKGVRIGKKVGGAALVAASTAVHRKVQESGEDNSAVEAAGKTEQSAELATRYAKHRQSTKKRATSSRQKLTEADVDMEGASGRLHFSSESEDTAAAKAKKQKKKKQQAEQRAARKQWQKRQYQKQYQMRFRRQRSAASETAKRRFVEATQRIGDKVKAVAQSFIKQNKHLIIMGIGFVLIVVLLITSISSCGALFSGGGGGVVGTTYMSSDTEIHAVEDAYCEMEEALNNQINRIESTYSGYDEYEYQVDEIGHNPYELISYLNVKYQAFKSADVASELERIFSEQYVLTLTPRTEIRTRIESSSYTDPETGETETDEYEVEYEVEILRVTLQNNGLDRYVRTVLGTDEQELYTLQNTVYGNREYLFDTATIPTIGGGSGTGHGGAGSYTDYDVPPEALSDARFSRMITEAEKYLGYPYVWGGSSPSTSFDCSGFISWVVNHSGNGWSVGRQTAEGLRNSCTRVSPSAAKPGDLIFFQGTYNTSGASHVGLYVGNGMMIHCGSPISYASIETSYWKQHFMQFGRLPN